MSFQFQRNNILPKHEPLNTFKRVGSFQSAEDSYSSPLASLRTLSEPNEYEILIWRCSVHWAPFTTSSVTISTGLLPVHFFASNSLTIMLKDSVTMNTHLQQAVSFAMFFADCKLGLCTCVVLDQVLLFGTEKYHAKSMTIPLLVFDQMDTNEKMTA